MKRFGCKLRLLFAKIAMAIWFQVSGVRVEKLEELKPDT